MTNGANGAELITLINTGLTFITVVTSIVSLHLAKKQIKQEIEQNRQKLIDFMRNHIWFFKRQGFLMNLMKK